MSTNGTDGAIEKVLDAGRGSGFGHSIGVRAGFLDCWGNECFDDCGKGCLEAKQSQLLGQALHGRLARGEAFSNVSEERRRKATQICS
jgi:hypothetical protein